MQDFESKAHPSDWMFLMQILDMRKVFPFRLLSNIRSDNGKNYPVSDWQSAIRVSLVITTVPYNHNS